jgi:hypothetical protein
VELPSGIDTQVDFEGVLFQAALRGLQEARLQLGLLKTRIGEFQWLDLYELFSRVERQDAIEPTLHPIARASDQAKESLERLLEGLVAAHVFGVMTLEAHINRRAQAALGGAMWRSFNELPLSGKWLLFPAILGKTPFDPGAEPFQGFSKLLSTRNALVHPRRGAERRLFPADTPTLEAASAGVVESEKAVNNVRAMAEALAEVIGTPPPLWVSFRGDVFFPFTAEPPPAFADAERRMWALMTRSDAVLPLAEVGLPVRPDDILRHPSFRRCAGSLGGYWYHMRDGNWKLRGPSGDVLYSPSTTAVIELRSGRILEELPESSSEPLEAEYAELRGALKNVLKDKGISESDFLKARL